MRRLLLHAGVHRTATTTIQTFLRENAAPLRQAGFLNPNWAGRNIQTITQLFAEKTSAQDIARLVDAAETDSDTPIHTLILSDEDICTKRVLGPIRALRRQFDVKVLISLRRQDLWLESWHQQNVKWQWNPDLAHLPFAAFLALRKSFHWVHYDKLIDRFADAFGRENLILRVFERSAMPEGPVHAFCQDIGLTDLSSCIMPADQNRSLTPVCSELMRNLPLDRVRPDCRALVERAMFDVDRQLSERQGKTSALLMDHATRTRILAEYDRGNRRVAKAHFGRDRLFSDPLPPADAALADPRLPADSATLVTDFLAPLIESLMAHVGDRLKQPPTRRRPQHK